MIANNRIENNDFSGVATADYCLAVQDTPFDCFFGSDPTITPEFLADQAAAGNAVINNELINNGTNPDSSHPFAFSASDLTMLSLEPSN